MSRQPELIVWGAGTSRTLRVHWMLAELNLEYDNRKVGPRTGETQTEAYKAINPNTLVERSEGSQPMRPN
jgi:glutathione S-transferase